MQGWNYSPVMKGSEYNFLRVLPDQFLLKVETKFFWNQLLLNKLWLIGKNIACLYRIRIYGYLLFLKIKALILAPKGYVPT